MVLFQSITSFMYVKKSFDNFYKDDNSTTKTPIDINVYLPKYKGIGISQMKYSYLVYVFKFDGALVSWKPSKKMCIARFIMESQIFALYKARDWVAFKFLGGYSMLTKTNGSISCLLG